jgi:glycosyltransferase involved in cell wall biosynthesis
MTEAAVDMAGAKLNSSEAAVSDAPMVDGRFSLRTLQLGMAWFAEQAGGLDRYYFELLAALGRRGVATRGLVVGSPKVVEMSGGVVAAHSSPKESLLRRWRGSRAAVKRALGSREIGGFDPDVIASHFALYTVAALGAIRRSGRPHVVHFHGPWAMECRKEGDRGVSNAFKRFIERRVYRSADLCIVLSEAFGKILAEDYGVAKDRIRVIPGGVDIERFKPTMTRSAARERLGWPTDRPILLAVRRLVPRMGLETLIEAMDVVRRGHPDVLLMIAGRGRLAEQLQKQITAAGLEKHVRLLGFLPDEQLPIAMRAADMTVVPSVALEGFGLTVVESLAAGTPCLVSPVGGLPEVVRELEPSLIFAKAAAAEIAERIAAALSGEMPLPSEDRCAAFAAERYDWDVIAGRVLDVYGEATGGSQKSVL